MKTVCARLNSIGSTFFLSALALAFFAVISGCGEKPAVRIGETPPLLSGTDVNGKHVRLDRLKGNVIILYFWSSSCCSDRVKQLEPYYSQNKNRGLTVLAVQVGGSRNSVLSFARNNGLSFTMLADEDNMIFREYGIIGFPTIFIIDRSGIVRKKILGDVQTTQLSKLVAPLL
ncbi:MAG TPA: TlpA disulfide reductase family protein [Geobacteraceae bacterium]